jgi:hypothetical protein
MERFDFMVVFFQRTAAPGLYCAQHRRTAASCTSQRGRGCAHLIYPQPTTYQSQVNNSYYRSYYRSGAFRPCMPSTCEISPP